jgi:phosphatidylinositol alpha-mannosyltransferase
MRIAVVCPYDLGRPGGGQDLTRRLVGWLRNAGHDATLVGPGIEGPEDAVLLGATTTIAINRSSAPVKLDPRVAGSVRRALSGFDVVHVHEPLVPMVSAAALAMPGPAKVATFHADPPQWVRSLYRFGAPALRRVLRGIDVVTAVSPVAAAPLDDAAVAYRIVPNGVDIADYNTGPKTNQRVTFLGRDDARKGLSVLLEAWPQVLTALPGATLHVLGAERPSIAGVTFLGRVSEEEKRAQLSASSVHCAPNLGGESFGIVVLEAMAAGSAIVASDIPAFAYVAGDTALFVPPGDTDALAAGVIELLGEPGRAGAAGAAARGRAGGFDGANVAARYIEAYEDALASQGR